MRFILVDSIVELIPGKSVTAVKFVDPGDDYFRDHFPGFPVVPGVLLTEMMAQAAGKCLDAERDSRGKAMLGRIRSASFREWVVPPATLSIKAEIETNRADFATAKCHVVNGDKKVAQSDLLFSFVPLDSFVSGYRDDVLEDYLISQETGEGKE